MDSGIEAECCKVMNNSIYFPEENICFTFDVVMDSKMRQEEVYEVVGKPAVEDVLDGYNGTIFAYGQTGTGKTYTIFGPDIHDEEMKGIIPRAVMDIFKVWEMGVDIKEVEIRCSMIEIYKENLNDLLADEYIDLKIKESPTRGIYIEGLIEIPVSSEEELMSCLELGTAKRKWAATRHNLVSTRSHTIFILEVRQILNDDSEKCGKLNMVDLAGSEKVGRSGLKGEHFAEGTKINLSLSVLGNVIHALGKKMDYIPYRESKLTRLLQESLGGNFKTALIVTCSLHLSQMQETISTLNFAQRAKKLRNKVQMNLKESPSDLLRLTQKLKAELLNKDKEINKLRQVIVGNRMTELNLRRAFHESSTFEKTKSEPCGSNNEDQSSNSKICEENIRLKEKTKKMKMQIELFLKEKAELERKLLMSEIALAEERKKVIFIEKQLMNLKATINFQEFDKEKSSINIHTEKIENKTLKSQLKALNEAIEDCESECFRLLKEKKDQLIKETVKMCNLNLLDFINKDKLSTSFTEKWVNDLDSVGLNLVGSFIGPKELFRSQTELKLDSKQLMASSKYAATIETAIINEQISTETLNYLLRIQLVDSSIINHNLKRVISLLIRKLRIERSNALVKSETCKLLQRSVDSLESFLKRANVSHQKWKNKIEKLDYEISLLKQQVESKNFSKSFFKARIRKPIPHPLRRSFLHNYIINPKQSLHGKEKNTPTESGEPQTVEINKAEELKLQEMDRDKCRNNNLQKPDTVGIIEDAPMLRLSFKGGELEELEINLREKQTELEWQKTFTDLLMSELSKTRKQADELRKEIEELKVSSEQAIQDESKNWQLVNSSLKVSYLHYQ